MAFRKNYLPSQAQPWAREVQSRIETMERDVVASDINNRTRDDQLQASYNRLDAAFGVLASQQSTLSAQQITLNNTVQTLDNTVQDLSDLIGNIYTAGTEEIRGSVITAGSITAAQISSSYIYAGTIDADQINAGTLTGFTIRTAASGRRIEMKGVDNSISFYDQNGAGLGHLAPARFGGTDYAIVLHRGPTSDPTSFDGPNVYLGRYNVSIEGDSDTGIIIGGLSAGIWAGRIALLVENELYIQTKGFGAFLATTNASGQLETDQGFRIAAGAMNIASGAQLNYAAPTSSSGVPAYIQTNNLVVRFSSSEQYKQQIKDIDFDYETLLSVPMKSFKFNADVERYGDEALTTYGYIAEDLHNAGLTDLVIYKRENGIDTPEAIQFHSLNAIYHQITKQHHDKINSLEQRIAALEGN